MKKIVLGLLLLVWANSYAQEAVVVPLGTIPDMMAFRDERNLRGVPLDILDVNNVLGKYVGTWQGEMNGKRYTIMFSKYLQLPTVTSNWKRMF